MSRRLYPTSLGRPCYALLALGLLLSRASAVLGQSSVQVPPVVQQEAKEIESRFFTVLDEECTAGVCYPVGCEVTNFATLDQRQTSSLPGLEETPNAAAAQYKLTSLTCAFAYEPGLNRDKLQAVRQRLTQKVRKVGVSVQIQAQELQPRPIINTPGEEASKDAAKPVELSWVQSLWLALLPYVPWFALLIALTLATLAIIWGFRRLGIVEAPALADASAPSAASAAMNLPDSQPTPQMLIARIEQVRANIVGEPDVLQQALRDQLERENFSMLCLFLRHFGADFLSYFKTRPEFRESLGKLSTMYDRQSNDDESPATIWAFLDRLERSLTAAKLRIDSQPLESEFAFLAAMEVDELLGVLREVSEPEALAAVAHAPAKLREKFFAQANPAFTAKFVEYLARAEKMPDAMVRETARKLRELYRDKGDGYRTVTVDRIPLLEQALNALAPEKRKQIMHDLGENAPQLVSAIVPSIFLDDSLPLLPDPVLTEAFLTPTPQEAGHYLATFAWGDTVMRRLNPRLQEAIAPHQRPRLVNPNLAALARNKIADFVRDQDRRGQIDLRKINNVVIGQAT